MTENNAEAPAVEVSAGVAESSAVQPDTFAGFAGILVSSGEYGVSFTHERDETQPYTGPPMPPPPAEKQHDMGLHPGAEGGE